ncbi:MAG: N-acetylmuramoyl-L-alanine amidase [Clostridium sp.]|uniref:N-acetylmuramoyl-L-alanine amidase n=1 Tax=Clostridium sp. TaxID=1506 RepID=UPI003D6D3106
MKIAIRGGHNSQATGANGIINELIEDRKVKDAVIKYLRLDNNEVIDVTPGNSTSSVDLNYGVNTANNAKVDLFASIHFNNVTRAFTGVIGSEIWLKPTSTISVPIANRILINLNKLGFKNRGIKNGWNTQYL